MTAAEGEGGGRSSRSLERSLGLPQALSMGMGTMIGAGIFVFPGLAVEEAGLAAALSFVIGAAVALLVALPTSELATAMPRSGGGYTFVSRVFGPYPGILVGVGQWLGLVFAAAFYLVGFGHYFGDLGSRLGLGELPPTGLACVAAVLLTLFLGWGALRAAGVTGSAMFAADPAPGGALPVVTTAALVFTSYLGFAQVANMAGEVRSPGRNLPLAMAGSVVLVGLMYAVTIVVSVGVVGPERLAEAGETALAEVGRELLGDPGGLVASAAGVLATLSSANASILSSSRAVFALSRDGALPEGVSRINSRFRTPHVALLLAGGPIALLTLLGRIEILAEIASILHLVMYGLMAGAVVWMARNPAWWYRPTFRTPARPLLPLAGAAASVALVAFMSPPALVGSGAIFAGASLWFAVRRRTADLEPTRQLFPPAPRRPASLLLEVELPDAPGIPTAVVRALDPQRLVLLGWVAVPEQTAPEQVREEMEEGVREELEEIARRLEPLDAEVETELVFTGDEARTISRIAEERESDSILTMRPAPRIDVILIPVTRPDLPEGVVRYMARLARSTRATLRIRGVGEEAAESDAPSTLRRRLRALGVASRKIRVWEEGVGDDEIESALAEAADQADLVLAAEEEDGEEDEAVSEVTAAARDAGIPLLVIRLPPEGPDGDGSDDDGG